MSRTSAACRWPTPFVLGVSLWLSPSRAPADDGSAAAEALFAAARSLAERGSYEEACPKFEQSYAIDPALGTLLNLGDCLEKTGRTATAWLRYREAAGVARVANEVERERIARGRAELLEPRLCMWTIEAGGREAPEDLWLTRDRSNVDVRTFGIATPIDPGSHAIRIVRGSRSEEQRIEIAPPADGAKCKETSFKLPDWAVAVDAPMAPTSTASQVLPTTTRPVEPPSDGGFGPHHVIAIATFGAGVIASGFGAGYGVDAIITQSSAEEFCRPEGCTAPGLVGLKDAGQSADAATVFFAVSGTLLVTGAILWLTSPSLDEVPAPSSALLHF